MLLNYFIAAK